MIELYENPLDVLTNQEAVISASCEIEAYKGGGLTDWLIHIQSLSPGSVFFFSGVQSLKL